MFNIYEEMKELIPSKRCRKYRQNDEFVIVCSNACKIHYLNSVAGEIFLQCDGKNNIMSILNYLKQNYDASLEELKEDLIHTLRKFQWEDIIELKEVG